jgi:2-hydroxycyclohexanecarboxyl-CoA dehydrogenase
VIAVNLTGTFLCIQAVIPDMVAAGWGRIITISSSSGQSGSPFVAHYSAAKGGVISLTKALAREYGPLGITVNTISPGSIDTPMIREAQAVGKMPSTEVLAERIPLGRLGTPAEVAAACAFLGSDEASYITGQIIGVNGGIL